MATGGESEAGFLISAKWSWLGLFKNKLAQRIAVASVVGVTIVTAAGFELKDSWLESIVFRQADLYLSYRLGEGKSGAIYYPAAGPYDQTLGYSRMPAFLSRLEAHGYQIEAQAHSSELFASLTGVGLYPVYDQKDQPRNANCRSRRP